MFDITLYGDQLKSLCLDHEVKELFLFGSALTDNFKPTSDIDLLVDFKAKNPLEYSQKYFDLKFRLEDLFGREVDLLEKRSLKNPFLIDSIDRYKTLIYAA